MHWASRYPEGMSQDVPSKCVAVFCSAADGRDPVYRAVAQELGRALAAHGLGLVYGGGKAGLMGAVADAALAGGGHVVGVIPHVLVDLEVAHDKVTELHVTETMHIRKAMMAERADAFLILPGGYGTLEEMFEVLAWQTLKLRHAAGLSRCLRPRRHDARQPRHSAGGADGGGGAAAVRRRVTIEAWKPQHR
jgi:uncharacterized protein (TIGR00730 family)